MCIYTDNKTGTMLILQTTGISRLFDLCFPAQLFFPPRHTTVNIPKLIYLGGGGVNV